MQVDPEVLREDDEPKGFTIAAPARLLAVMFPKIAVVKTTSPRKTRKNLPLD